MEHFDEHIPHLNRFTYDSKKLIVHLYQIIWNEFDKCKLMRLCRYIIYANHFPLGEINIYDHLDALFNALYGKNPRYDERKIFTIGLWITIFVQEAILYDLSVGSKKSALFKETRSMLEKQENLRFADYVEIDL